MDEEEIKKNKDPNADKTFILNTGFLERFRELISDLSVDVQKNADLKKKDFIVRPRAPGVYPGILVFHDWWGLDDYVRSVCLRLAKKGFVAIAPSLYYGEMTHRESVAKILMKNVNPEKVMEIVEGYFEKLMTYPFVDRRYIGTIGFLMGGYYSLLAAAKIKEIKASAAIYGHFPRSLSDQELSQITNPVFLASGVLEDWLEQEEFNLYSETFKDNKVNISVQKYENVRLNFMDELHPEGFDYGSTENLWKQLGEFFETHLRPVQPKQSRVKRYFGFLGGGFAKLAEDAIGEKKEKPKENAEEEEEEDD